MRGTSVPSSSRKMQARSTPPSAARRRQAVARRWSIERAVDADSMRLTRTSAWARRRASERRVQASVRAPASFGATWRSRWGAAAAAGSTVRTPITSPSRMSGSACAERMPRRARSLSVARRPSARPWTGRRSRTTAARKGEPHSGTGVRSSGTARPSAVSATACRKGTAISVVASWTKTETRVAPDSARSRYSMRSRAAVASYGEGMTDICRTTPSTPRSLDTD